LRAARANRVFFADEKHIRAENTVLVNSKQDLTVLYKIDDPCGRFLVRATPATLQQRGHDLSRQE